MPKDKILSENPDSDDNSTLEFEYLAVIPVAPKDCNKDDRIRLLWFYVYKIEVQN